MYVSVFGKKGLVGEVFHDKHGIFKIDVDIVNGMRALLRFVCYTISENGQTERHRQRERT